MRAQRVIRPTRRRRRVLRRLFRTKSTSRAQVCAGCETEQRLCLNGHPDGPELAPLCVECWDMIQRLALGSEALAAQRSRRLIYRYYRARGDRPMRAWMRAYWIELFDPRRCAADPRDTWAERRTERATP